MGDHGDDKEPFYGDYTQTSKGCAKTPFYCQHYAMHVLIHIYTPVLGVRVVCFALFSNNSFNVCVCAV